MRGGADSGGPTAPVNVAIPGHIPLVTLSPGNGLFGPTSVAADTEQNILQAAISPLLSPLQPSQSGMFIWLLSASVISNSMVPAAACVIDTARRTTKNMTENVNDVRDINLIVDRGLVDVDGFNEVTSWGKPTHVRDFACD